MSGAAKAILTSSVAGRSSRLVRLNIEPASKVFGGATGETWMMRPFLPARTIRSSSGVWLAAPFLARRETVPMRGAAMPDPEIEPVVDVGVDERHLGGMDRAGDGFLDEGVPAGALGFDAGNQAGHVLIGGDRRKTDPDAEADDQGRQERTLVSAGGGRLPRH